MSPSYHFFDASNVAVGGVSARDFTSDTLRDMASRGAVRWVRIVNGQETYGRNIAPNQG